MKHTPKVHIIILNWNGWRDTIDCVKSCQQIDYPELEILVVDNGSSDDSVANLRLALPGVTILKTGNNLGFAEGNNVGMRRALSEGAEFVWLLNNDTTVNQLALDALVNVALDDERVGMVGSKILYHDDPSVIWYAGTFTHERKPFHAGHRGLMEKDRGQYDEVCETDYITGCSLLVKKKLIEEIGVLDSSFFLYFEDIDWCARAKARGWKLIYCPQSLVFHKISRSSGGELSPLVRYYTARNLLYFVKKNYSDKLCRALGYTFFQYVIVPVKKRRIQSAIGAIKGIIDFLFARTGKKRE